MKKGGLEWLSQQGTFWHTRAACWLQTGTIQITVQHIYIQVLMHPLSHSFQSPPSYFLPGNWMQFVSESKQGGQLLHCKLLTSDIFLTVLNLGLSFFTKMLSFTGYPGSFQRGRKDLPLQTYVKLQQIKEHLESHSWWKGVMNWKNVKGEDEKQQSTSARHMASFM